MLCSRTCLFIPAHTAQRAGVPKPRAATATHCALNAQWQSPMSHGCWGFGPKAVQILLLGIKAQTLEEAPLPEWEPNISIGGQIITLPACFAFKTWVWLFGEVYIKTVKIVCLIPVRGYSHGMQWRGALRKYYRVLWKASYVICSEWRGNRGQDQQQSLGIPVSKSEP